MAATAERFHVSSPRRYPMNLRAMGTVTAGDDDDCAVIPFVKGRLVGVVMSVNTTGSGSASTGIMLERHRDESTVDDMITELTIAHDATTVHSQAIKDDINSDGTQEVQQGDLIMLNTDTAPGTPGVDVCVCAIFHIDQE